MNNQQVRQIDTARFSKLVLTALGLLALAVLFGYLFKSAVEMLLLIFAGVLFAIFIRGVNAFVFRGLLPEKISILLTVILLFAAAAAFIILVAPHLADQVQKLFDQLPRSLEQLRGRTGAMEMLQNLKQFLPDSAQSLSNAVKNMTGKALGFLATTFGVITSLFIFLFIGLYLSFSPYIYISGIIRLFPERNRGRADEIFQALGYTLGHWLIGRFIGMLVVGVTTYLGLLVLQVPLALSLATLAGLLTFIPNIGPIISAIPAILLGFSESMMTAVYVAVLYIVIQTIESYLITPLVQQHEVALPPVLTLSSQVVLGSILGVLGLILATPLTAAGLVLIKMLYIENVLGSRSDVKGVET